MNCDTARIYVGAVADGELDAVPAGILEHIRACHDCSTEVHRQRADGVIVLTPDDGVLHAAMTALQAA